jgi:hypothetical protein
MKGAFIGLFIGFALLVFSFLILNTYRSNTSFTIHYQDTYFVLEYGTAVVFALVLLGMFFSIGGLIGTYFKGKLFWTIAIICLAISTYYAISFYKAFKSINTSSLLNLRNYDVIV